MDNLMMIDFHNRMKIKRLSIYIARYSSLENVVYVEDELNSRNIRYLQPEEGIPMIHYVLSHVCSMRTIAKIMTRFLAHEVKRERLTPEQMGQYIYSFGYSCTGCLDDQPNQLAHMELGGCLYCEENGFC